MSKHFLPALAIALSAGICLPNCTQGNAGNVEENPNARYQKILRNVGILLEEGHFSPRKIDDGFSEIVMKEFLKDLDPEKSIFLQSDINALLPYAKVIDDEIHGKELKSFFEIEKVYNKRQGEVMAFYGDYLKKPFDFTVKESINADPETYAYPQTEAERRDMWRKRIKYMVLDRYSLSLDDREKNKGTKGFVSKADTTLEREARESVARTLNRTFTTKRSRENEDFLFSNFVNAIANTMDPHTDYMAPVDLRTFNEGMRGNFYGIGAVLKEEDGKVKIGPMQTGMPAQKSGQVTEGDEVMKVGQGEQEAVDVTGYNVQDVVKLIRGATLGSVVKLTLRKLDGSVKVVALKRDNISLDTTFARSYIINGKNKIGYIYLPEFYTSTDNNPNSHRSAEDVAKEVQKLKDEKVEGIILDLRGNGGGSLYDVVKMAGLFIESGPIVQVKSRDQKPNVLNDRDNSVLYSGPLAVMVDEMSASASEIFAAAIQDYHRGIIIGSTSSYGKGTVQRNIPLTPEGDGGLFGNKNQEDLGSLKLTLQKFYRINGDATQRKGVVPDIIIPDRLEYLKFRERDNEYALPYDEISKAPYTTWNSTYSIPEIASAANAELKTSPVFSKISSYTSWLDSTSEKTYSLNLVDFRKDQAKFKAVYKQLDTLYKLPTALNITNLEADKAKISGTREAQDNNNDFLKRIKNDVYLDEALKVMSKMVTSNTAAK